MVSEGGGGGLMPPPRGFVNEVIKGWMPPASDFVNFGKEIYSVAETLSSKRHKPCAKVFTAASNMANLNNLR